MDEKLFSDLVLLAVASVLAAIAWFIRGINADVKKLVIANEGHVTKEQHNALAQSIREAIKATDLDVRELKTRIDMLERGR